MYRLSIGKEVGVQYLKLFVEQVSGALIAVETKDGHLLREAQVIS